MARSNRGILLAVGVGVGVLAGVGVSLFYFQVVGPRHELRRVQAEVAHWGAHWEVARRCLVGEAPASSDGYEAVILREALQTEDMVEALAPCTALMSTLKRADGPSAGAKVEAAWVDLRKAVVEVAEAEAWRAARTPDRPPAALRLALAHAVTGLDSAYAALRVAADMPPARRPGGSPAASPADRMVHAAGGQALVPIRIDGARVRDNVLNFVARSDAGRIMVRQRGPDTVEVVRFGDGVVPATGGGWGVWDDGGGLESGALDASGAPAGSPVRLASASPTGGAPVPLYAAGAGHERLVVYHLSDARGAISAWLVRSHDDGAHWDAAAALHRPLAPGQAAAFGNPALARIDLTWIDPPTGQVEWLPIDESTATASAPPAARVLFDHAPDLTLSPCVGGSRSWWWAPGMLFVTDGTGPAQPVAGASLMGEPDSCDDHAVLALDADGDKARVTVCNPGGCRTAQAPLADGAAAAATFDQKGQPLVATETDGLVVLWAAKADAPELRSTRIVRLPAAQHLTGLAWWNGAPYLVTHTDTSLHILPLGA